jgi:hypothetical protein
VKDNRNKLAKQNKHYAWKQIYRLCVRKIIEIEAREADAENVPVGVPGGHRCLKPKCFT